MFDKSGGVADVDDPFLEADGAPCLRGLGVFCLKHIRHLSLLFIFFKFRVFFIALELDLN